MGWGLLAKIASGPGVSLEKDELKVKAVSNIAE